MRQSAFLRRLALSVAGLPFRVMSRLRPRRIVVFHAFADFERKSRAIASLLKEKGLPVVVRAGGTRLSAAEVKASADLWVGFWNDFPLDCLPERYVFFNAEPLALPVWDWTDKAAWIEAMRGAAEVWDYHRPNAARAASLGIRARYVPFGYAAEYERSFRAHIEGRELAQDIDVLFVGRLSERRKRMIELLRSRGMAVRVVSREEPAHGAQLDELLARSKIILDIHQFPETATHIVDLARLDHLLSNGLFVIHETPIDADAGFLDHVATCAYERIPETCERFLAEPGERARLASEGREWFKAEFDLRAFLPYDELAALLRE